MVATLRMALASVRVSALLLHAYIAISTLDWNLAVGDAMCWTTCLHVQKQVPD